MKKVLLVLSVAALTLTSCSKEEITEIEIVEEVELNLYDELSESFKGVAESRVLGNTNGVDFVEKVYYGFIDNNSVRVATLYNNDDCLEDGEEFVVLDIELVENTPNYFKFTFGDGFEIRGYRIEGDLSVNGTISGIYEEQVYKLTNWLPSSCN